MVKTKDEIKNEISEKKKLVETPKFSGGSLEEIQDTILDLYDKLNDINERI
ncbi:MAG: hypothetical protein KJI69_05725 [Patescibacteria group bacterium]|nr:hypothetical protein [Patescibacteria group bacterium]